MTKSNKIQEKEFEIGTGCWHLQWHWLCFLILCVPRRAVQYPQDEKDEILAFLEDGPAPATAPAWIDWGRPEPRVVVADAGGADSAVPAASAPDAQRRGAV